MIRGGKEGYERLLLLARDLWPDAAAPFERAGLSPEMRCALTTLQHFTADPQTLICGPRIFQLWSRR